MSAPGWSGEAFAMSALMFSSAPFLPVVLWCVVSALLAGICINLCRKRSAKTQRTCFKSSHCGVTSTSVKLDQSATKTPLILDLGYSEKRLTLKSGEETCCEEMINITCDCQHCATDSQELIQNMTTPPENVPLGLCNYRALLYTLIFMFLCEVTFHLLWRSDEIAGSAVVRFVQFLNASLGVLFAHTSQVDEVTGVELTLRVIVQNKLACLMSYLALESIILYGISAVWTFGVSEDVLMGIIVIYICLYSTTIGVMDHMCLNHLFKFTVVVQIPVIAVLMKLLVYCPLSTFFFTVTWLWLILSSALFAAKIMSAIRHIDNYFQPSLGKESEAGLQDVAVGA